MDIFRRDRYTSDAVFTTPRVVGTQATTMVALHYYGVVGRACPGGRQIIIKVTT